MPAWGSRRDLPRFSAARRRAPSALALDARGILSSERRWTNRARRARELATLTRARVVRRSHAREVQTSRVFARRIEGLYTSQVSRDGVKSPCIRGSTARARVQPSRARARQTPAHRDRAPALDPLGRSRASISTSSRSGRDVARRRASKRERERDERAMPRNA